MAMYDIICHHTNFYGLETTFVVQPFDNAQIAIDFSQEYARLCERYEGKRENYQVFVKSRKMTKQELQKVRDHILL
jgi:hypothetical protein